MVKDFYNSLSNAVNLNYLAVRRSENLKIKKISDFVYDTLLSVKTLDLSGGEINYPQNIIDSLDGIEKVSNLKNLYLSTTSGILNIDAIKNCNNLEKIYISNANVQSISSLISLNNLKILNLNNNNINNLKSLENLTNLTELNLENNAISDTATYTDTDGSVKTVNNINILTNLNKNKNGRLEKLYLSGNDNIVDWAPLSSLTWTAKSGW